MRIEAKFPFDLFPDHIDIEKDKIKITRRFFFNEEEVVSVFLPDIAEIILQKGPIFASLTFIERGPLTRPVAIRYLDKHDAAWAHDTILQMITKLKISQV